MSSKITIRPAEGIWVVRAGGAVLGESEQALAVTDGDGNLMIYFPRADIAMEFLDPSPTRREDAGIGVATFFSIVTKSTTLKDAAWGYEAPAQELAEIAGHLAFPSSDTVAVEQI